MATVCCFSEYYSCLVILSKIALILTYSTTSVSSGATVATAVETDNYGYEIECPIIFVCVDLVTFDIIIYSVGAMHFLISVYGL